MYIPTNRVVALQLVARSLLGNHSWAEVQLQYSGCACGYTKSTIMAVIGIVAYGTNVYCACNKCTIIIIIL